MHPTQPHALASSCLQNCAPTLTHTQPAAPITHMRPHAKDTPCCSQTPCCHHNEPGGACSPGPPCTTTAPPYGTMCQQCGLRLDSRQTVLRHLARAGQRNKLPHLLLRRQPPHALLSQRVLQALQPPHQLWSCVWCVRKSTKARVGDELCTVYGSIKGNDGNGPGF